MINFKVKGIQYKNDEHGKELSTTTYKSMNILVIPLVEAKHISSIVVSCSDIHNIVEVWKELCNAAQYFNCKMVCWHHDCQFVVNPDSNPNLIDDWASYIIDYRLLHFGPDEPKITEEYMDFNNSYSATERTLSRLYKEMKEAKQKRAKVIFNRFASNIEDKIKPEEFRPGTPKVVKKYANQVLKMVLGILDKSKEKYLIDFKYNMSNNFTYTIGPNNRKFRVQDYLFEEWLDSLEELKGNYGENFEIIADYTKKYLMKKLEFDDYKFQDTYYSYFINLIKNHD